MAIRATRGPDEHDHARAQQSNGDVPDLAIVEPVVDALEHRPGENLSGIGKIKPSIDERRIALDGIEADLHHFLYMQKIGKSTGAALIDANQSSSDRDLELQPSYAIMPVREIA
jgi:hypothetical protein